MHSLPLVFAAFCVLVGSAVTRGQVSPDEHAKHHPGAAPTATQPGGQSSSGSAAGGGGMMAGMGEMMKNMGAPPPKALYPSLMDLPDLPPEKRDEVQRAAHERMKSGADLMAKGLDQLVKSAPTTDYAAMQAAMVSLREGVARFDSGLAAHRAIAEGKDPRQLAMKWFKEQMNLRTPSASLERAGPFGVSWSHLIVMVLLVAFAAVMIAMYFFKMRRAAALFGRLESNSGKPPPGSAPPLAGASGPSAPGGSPTGRAPPPAAAAITPPSANAKAAGPASPAADAPPALGTSPGGPPVVPVPNGDAQNAG